MIHIYTVAAGLNGYPHEIAWCEEDALGMTLRVLREERQLTNNSRVGILQQPDAEGPGVWLVNPWANGREEQ